MKPKNPTTPTSLHNPRPRNAAALIITIVAILAMQTCASCSHIKRIVGRTSVDTDSVGKRTTTELLNTITERSMDTTIIVPADTLAGLVDIPMIGDTSVIEDDNQITYITPAPNKPGKLSVTSVSKPKPVTARLHEKTTQIADTKTVEKTKLDKKVKTRNKAVEKEQSPWYIYLITPAFFVVVVIIGLIKRKVAP